MRVASLTTGELDMMRAVFRRHSEIIQASVFGSRAKGTHTERSDVDLAVAGNVTPLVAEAIAAELDELPLPYRFEVHSLAHIGHHQLLEHIRRAGIVIYPDCSG